MKTKLDQSGPARHPRWMVVDDDENILSLMHFLVAQFSEADVECYQSPQAALAAFESALGAFELVITDLEMPGMSGLELCQRLHALAPKTKILLATGSEILTDAEALDRGFCGLLRKPFSIISLKRALNSIGVGKISVDLPATTMVLMAA